MTHYKLYSMRVIAATFFGACLFVSCKKDAGAPEPFASLLNRQNLAGARQVVVVMPADQGNKVTILMADKKENRWVQINEVMTGIAGKNGFAEAGEKKEGDGKTPLGVYSLSTAFGYEPGVDTKLPYRQTTENDIWIDDTESPYYNQWVDHGVGAKSFEKMRRTDILYKYGIVVEYNTNPVSPGMGSAIFFHVWRAPDKPTLGCIAVSEKNMVALLQWLDAEKKPVVVIGREPLF